VLLTALATGAALVQAASPYAWHAGAIAPADTLAARIAPPPGFTRVAVEAGSFGLWLRGVPLLPGRPEIRLFDGRPKHRQDVHEAVLDIDPGRRDLQQCADAVMRLHAEYLFGTGHADDVAFTLTSGDPARARDWLAGARPHVAHNRVRWSPGDAPADRSHAAFRSYLDFVFTYAGSASLSRTLASAGATPIAAGDVFIQGGFPGHAMLVVDVARDARGRAVFLLAQSYMPAQQIHVVRNFEDASLSPWFAEPTGALVTPEWTFRAEDRKRWR